MYMSFCFRRVSKCNAFQDLLGILLKLKFLFKKKLQILKNKITQCNKGSFLLNVQQQQSKYQVGFWMCTASAEGTGRSRKESRDAILTMKNYRKKGHHYCFCCYWFATLPLSLTLLSVYRLITINLLFFNLPIFNTIKKKTRKNE